MIKTNSYVGCAEEEIIIGGTYCLGQLIDSESEEQAEEILESGCVGIGYFGEDDSDFKFVEFKAAEQEEEILDTVVTVIDMY